MTVEVNGIAHIQLTVNDPDRCIPFWEKLCHFLEMKTLIKGDGVVYCIGSRTGILVRGAPAEKRGSAFDQNRAGLHHFCFRARSREDIDAIHLLRRGRARAPGSSTRPRKARTSRRATTRCSSRIRTGSASK